MRSLNKFLMPMTVGAALLLAACGSSSQKSSPSAVSASPPASQSVSRTSAGLTIGTKKASVGTYLTGTGGRALYIWVGDSAGKSSCAGGCATAWPPLTVGSMPKVTGGASAADISLITRSGGAKQVTYKGRPLYYYAGDTGPGTTNGQGSDQFGAKWWLISPSGGPVGSSSSAASKSSPASGGSATGSGSGWG